MKVLNLCKGLLAVGALSVVLSSCNMEDHKKDREGKAIEKQTEIKKTEKSAGDANQNDALHRQAE